MKNKKTLARFHNNVADWNYYFRECKPLDMDIGSQDEYIIVKEIVLDDYVYESFQENFLREWDFVRENSSIMGIKNRVWHCILVKGETSNDAILVNSEGHSYARYIAYKNEMKLPVTEEDVMEYIQSGFEFTNDDDRFDLQDVTFKNWALELDEDKSFWLQTYDGSEFEIKITKK